MYDMKIAIFSDTYQPQINGVVRCIDSLKQEYENLGNKVMVVAPTGTKTRFKTIRLPFYKDYHIAALPYRKALNAIKKFKPDIIHSHTPFSIGMSAVIAKKLLRVPLISTFHTMIPEYFSYYFFDSKIAKESIWKYLVHYYKLCDAVTTPSNNIKKELSKRLKREVLLMRNGVDIKKFSPNKNSKYLQKKYGKIILHVGRLSKERNIEFLIKNIGELLESRNDSKFLIVGTGPKKEKLEGVAEKYSNIVFTGVLTESELSRLYASSTVFVTASKTDVSPLVVLESYASGLPVLGINKGGVAELISEGETNLLFNGKKDFNLLKIK